MNKLKPPHFQAAFSLLELVLAVIILAIISVYVSAKFSRSGSYQQDTIAEQIVSTGQLAQQLSMNDSSRSFSLLIENSQISLYADGTIFSSTGLQFPLIFNPQVTLSPTGSVGFNNLGNTSGIIINISIDGNQNVCFESSGLIHRC